MSQQCENWPEGKWHWMMEYCKRKLLHPGEAANWKQAEKAYEERKELPETLFGLCLEIMLALIQITCIILLMQ